jgi:beta-galactosidase
VIKIVRQISRTLLGILVLLILPASVCPQRPVSLDGIWRFMIDPTDSGEKNLWFNQNLPASIKLPGIMQPQYGLEISTSTPWVLSQYDRFWYLREDYKAYADPGKVKVPFLSQPPRHYLGVAWYQRDIQIPQYQQGRRFVLTLERPHWETTVWLDGQKIGSNRSLVAPHVYDLATVSAGRHVLTIRVDNRMVMPYRPDAHSVSDSLGGSWNGIVGRIELTDTGRVWIDDAQAFPNLAQKSMVIKVRIGNQTGLSGSGTLTAIWPDAGTAPVTWDEHGGAAEVQVPLRAEYESWDEFNPRLYPLRLWLRGAGVDEYYDLRVGLRNLRAVGKEFVLNGRPIIFRGTHNGGDFPLTGYPPTDVASWRKLFETCKRWGLNHMRFHSWSPPEAAFQAADELGFYLQVEPGMWNEISLGSPMERMLYEETDRMIKAYGNHPSFMLMSASNEPSGKWQEALSKWVERYRREDPRRLYTTGTGHTEREIPNLTEGTDYLDIHRIGPKMLRRESGWFGNDYGQTLSEINLPVIAHEVGQWAAYPDYDVIKKFTGYMRPFNFEIFRDSLKAHGLLEKNQSFVYNSGRFQLAAYKEEIEANLRTPGLSGFQLFDLHDYLGQGTALVGLLDAFWDPKSYVTAEEFKRFSNTTVPLARFRQHVFTTADTLDVDVEVAHFGAEPIEKAVAVWKIGTKLKGEWGPLTIPIGKNFSLGKITVDLSRFLPPGQYKLVVTVGPESFFSPVDRAIIPGPKVVRGVTYFENEWNFWVYPAYDPEEYDARLSTTTVEAGPCLKARDPDVLVTSSWDEAEQKLAAGGRVLFVARNTELGWASPPLDRVPIFGNRLMRPAWSRMLGLWINRKLEETKSHMLDGFPTDTYFDWQWAEIIQNVRAVNLDNLPAELEPVVWAIDDWNRNYKLGVLFEVAVGDGRLLISAFDVSNRASPNPVVRQLRYALLKYARSDCFQPQVSVSPEQVRSLFFDTRIMTKLGARAEVNGGAANAAIDGDPNTFILVGDQDDVSVREQVDLKITLKEPITMSGVVLMSRQSNREHEGDIRGYVLQVSDDGREWREVARGELLSTFVPQQIDFSSAVTARYLKLIALSGFGTDKTTALAELAVITDSPIKKSKSKALPLRIDHE